MNRAIILGSILLFVFSSAQAFATPPQSVKLEYDDEAGILHVNIEHTSRDLNNHYIRKIVLTKNAESPQEYFYNTRQPVAFKFVIDIPFMAKNGDEVTVAVYSTGGGMKEATLSIELPSQELDQAGFPYNR